MNILYEHRRSDPDWMDTFAYKLRLAMDTATPTRTELIARETKRHRKNIEGISVKELAARSGVSATQIYQILNGTRNKDINGKPCEPKIEMQRKLLNNC